MNEQSTRFRFIVEPIEFRPESGCVGRVPAGVSGKEQLLQVLKAALQFPDYFGRNWDALLDCLSDLSWLPSGCVFLVHDALPELPENDLQAYVDVLATAVGNWKPQEAYELVVVFPQSVRQRLLELPLE